MQMLKREIFLFKKGANIDIHVILSRGEKNFINFRDIFLLPFIFNALPAIRWRKAIFISSFLTLFTLCWKTKKNCRNFLKLLICGKKKKFLHWFVEFLSFLLIAIKKVFRLFFFLYTIMAQYLIKIKSNGARNEKSFISF